MCSTENLPLVKRVTALAGEVIFSSAFLKALRFCQDKLKCFYALQPTGNKKPRKLSSRIHQLSRWQQQTLPWALPRLWSDPVSLKWWSLCTELLWYPPQAAVTAVIFSCCCLHLPFWEKNAIPTSTQPEDEWTPEDSTAINDDISSGKCKHPVRPYRRQQVNLVLGCSVSLYANMWEHQLQGKDFPSLRFCLPMDTFTHCNAGAELLPKSKWHSK